MGEAARARGDVVGEGGPGVVLCHAWWGVSDGMRTYAGRLAAAGFLVVLPDLYDGRVARTPDEAEALRGVFPIEVRQRRFDDAVDRLLAAPQRRPGRLGAVGFSMGVAWALGLAAARPDDVAAVAMYYGTGDAETFRPGSFAAIGHFAGSDEWEEPEAIAALGAHLGASEIPYTPYTYPGTTHWFAETDVSSAYDSTAANRAFDRSVSFLRSRLIG